MQGPRGYLRAWAPMEGTNLPTRAQWPLMGPLGLGAAAQGLWLAPVMNVPRNCPMDKPLHFKISKIISNYGGY